MLFRSRYFTNTENTDITDSMCEGVLKTIIKNGRILAKDPGNYNALEQIGLCGTIAHNGILGLGRNEDWACHGMGHELSGMYDVAHGSTLSVMTPAWMEYVKNENKEMFVQFAVNVFGITINLKNSDEVINRGINCLKQFYKELGLPDRKSVV